MKLNHCKWKVVSPYSREGQWESMSNISPFPCSDFVSLVVYNFYAPGDDSPHGGILLLLCPYVLTYVCPSLVKVFG